jgi:hypothetical protein
MISFWVTRAASFGIDRYRLRRGKEIAQRFEPRHYDELTTEVRIDHGPQIMSAVDQIGPRARAAVGLMLDEHARLAPGSARFNDPRHVLLRVELLNRLQEAGMNRFGVWRAADFRQVDRFPVFLRAAADHSGPRTELLRSQREIAQAVRALRVRGHRLRDLIVVEFCDASGCDGLFRKYAAFRVGDHILPCHLMTSSTWQVKSMVNTVDRRAIEAELEYVETNPHEGWLWRVFELAGIQFGRVDYGVSDGVPQIWEINTNPTLGPDSSKYYLPPDLLELRSRARDGFHNSLRAAFITLDESGSTGASVRQLPSALVADLREEVAARRRRQRTAERLMRWYQHPSLGWPVRLLYRTLFGGENLKWW